MTKFGLNNFHITASSRLAAWWALHPIPPHLSFPRSPLFSLRRPSLLPAGEDCASSGALRHVFAGPFAGDEHPTRYARPLPTLTPPLPPASPTTATARRLPPVGHRLFAGTQEHRRLLRLRGSRPRSSAAGCGEQPRGA